MKPQIARLHYAASESDADQLYATGFFVPDPFLWLKYRGKSHAVFSPLEVDRAKRQAQVDRVWAIEDFLPESQKARSAADLILAVATKLKFKSIEVPSQFPLGLARLLESKKLRVISVKDAFFPEREIKSAQEAQAVSKALRITEAGLERGLEVLKSSRTDKSGHLTWGGERLTSERLRGEIDATIVKLGGQPAHTIVAGGDQACDPHERGSGPLKTGQAIIIDIFPRDATSGYFGDLTRTVVRGHPSEALRHLYSTVQEGKKWVFKQMKPGVDGAPIHQQLVKRFEQAGYPTVRKNGRWHGFFHGIGHGLGLEIHESPRFSATKFNVGQMITVEPGLYIPGLGGVRLEDVAWITKTGTRNLTKVPEFFEI